MRDLVQRDSQSPKIQQLAFYLGSPAAIDDFLRSTWIVKPDPIEAEYIESPVFQIEQFEDRGFFAGDCDDAATMAGALLHALGWPFSFIAYKMAGAAEFSHVNVRVPGAGSWLAEDLEIDTTTPLNQLPIRGAVELMEVSL
jgi:hypothetical protein